MKDEKEIKTDRLGNRLDPTMPYARGELITSTQDDMAKLRKAWGVIRLRVAEQGRDALFNLSGLERGLGDNPEQLDWLDDEMAPALYVDRLTELGLEHLGGDAEQHGIMVMNRQTGALLAATLVMVKPGETVVGVSPSHSHPAIRRAAMRAGARFAAVVAAVPCHTACGFRCAQFSKLTSSSAKHSTSPTTPAQDSFEASGKPSEVSSKFPSARRI